MKHGAVALLWIILLVAGCGSLTPSPGEISDLPKPIPTDAAIATLSSESSVYESKEFGFRLQIPAGYRVEELPIRKGILLAVGFAHSNNDQTQHFGFPVGLAVYEKPPDVPLPDWFSTHIGDLTESGQPSSEDAFFYAPLIQNQNDFKGEP